ncbi:YggT family protein [Prochlorococcus marinus]|uniref:YggT family protein n=1 Tax=Prochlorococcus marinus TaxID=1219 RepID=UPI0022B3B134|nr:YggT family protein [Prochlorococcus marinus]
MPLLVKSLPTIHFLLGFVIGALTLAFLLRIILTWYPKINLRTGFWPIIFLPTEPVLVTTRKIVPPIGGVDVTPIIWVGLLSLFRELFLGQQGVLTQIIF